jgi:hypothetical protein
MTNTNNEQRLAVIAEVVEARKQTQAIGLDPDADSDEYVFPSEENLFNRYIADF